MSRRFKIAATTFHVTSTNPIPLYSFFPFGMSTTVCHVASSATPPLLKRRLCELHQFSPQVPTFLLRRRLLLSLLFRQFPPVGNREPPFQVLGANP